MLAGKLKVEDYLVIHENSLQNGSPSEKVMADVVEALVGAFFIDKGFSAASWFFAEQLFAHSTGIFVDCWNDPSQDYAEELAVGTFRLIFSNFQELEHLLPLFEGIEKLLNVKFRSKKLLMQAFTHPTYWKFRTDLQATQGPHYQLLEFLGDSVLQLVVTEHLFLTFPTATEGQMSVSSTMKSLTR